MKTIPNTETALIARTYFSDQSVWDHICAEIQKPVRIFQFVAYVDDLDRNTQGSPKSSCCSFCPPNAIERYLTLITGT